MSLRHAGTRAFRPSTRLAMLGLVLLTGCGGSGSSGFDVASEAAALMRALDQGSCVVFDGTTYCGSGASLSLDHDTVSVRIDRAKTPRGCEPQPAAGCAPFVPFVPDGFPDGTVFRAAAAVTAEGPWTLLPTGAQGNDPQVVQLPGPPSDLSLVAVLAYVRGAPNDLPAEAPNLAVFRADAVYVREPFEAPSVP